jgi:hypothetical protein
VRGAPHYHIVVSGSVDAADMSRAWYRIVGSGDVLHLLHGCNVLPVRPGAALMSYLAKYMGKEWESSLPTGRCWGLWGSVPQVVDATVSFLSRSSYVAFLRRLRRWKRGYRWASRLFASRGFCLYGSSVRWLVRGLPDVVIEDSAGVHWVRERSVGRYWLSDTWSVEQLEWDVPW